MLPAIACGPQRRERHATCFDPVSISMMTITVRKIVEWQAGACGPALACEPQGPLLG
jgi:hypothetical protein